MFAYRSTSQETTKFSPYKFLFGKEVRIPIDVAYYRSEHEAENILEFIYNLRENLENIVKKLGNTSAKIWKYKKIFMIGIDLDQAFYSTCG